MMGDMADWQLDQMEIPEDDTPTPEDYVDVTAVYCYKCGDTMHLGHALRSTWVDGTPDFIGDTFIGDTRADVVTQHQGGPGEMITVLKCRGCGHSITTGR